VIDVARLPFARLTRTPRAWIPVLAWTLLAVVSAALLRRSGSTAMGGALEGVFGQLALPFVCFTVVGAALGGDGLARSTRPFVAFGASPTRVALATIGVAVIASGLVVAGLGASVAALAHGASDPPLARDVLTTAWVAGLGGAAYGALFSFGASFGSRGAGRSVALVVDWVLGAGTGAAGCSRRARTSAVSSEETRSWPSPVTKARSFSRGSWCSSARSRRRGRDGLRA